MGRAALILAILAVAGLWGGPAIAAKLVTGRDVKDRSLTGRDVKSNSLTGRVVAGLSGRDVQSDSIDGTDVLESSLSQVPAAKRADRAEAAGRADTAGSVNGTTPHKLLYMRPVNGEATTVLNAGNFRIVARCTGAGLISVTALTAAPAGWLRVWGSTRNQGPQPFHQEDDDFRPGEEFNLLAGGDDNVAANFTYSGDDGHVVTGTFIAESAVSGHNYACLLSGTALHAAA